MLLLALSTVSASPVARNQHSGLPFVTRFDARATGFGNIADADRARAAALRANAIAKKNGKRDGESFNVNNTAVTYTASVGVGSPATQYTLLIDTGSSNTWVGAATKYSKTSTSKDTGSTVSVSYGSGSFSGEEYTDQITLSDNLVIKNQSIGVASKSQGFGSGIDGILGIGPVALTAGTLADKTATVPTVTDNLFSEKTISSNSIGIYYVPASESDPTGELTFGGVDTSKTTGDVAYTPITSTSPASEYWGIDQSISYGSTTILKSTAGIVDTGTTLILLATDAFQAYTKATGGTEDSTTGLLKISQDDYNNLKPLDFQIGSNTYSLSPNAQIWPRSLNSQLGGDSGSIYLAVADLGQQSGQGLDFINGYQFLERHYSVYDTGKKQVGFATTQFTNSTSN
ncbi:hypothetical protein PLICRDRAFT_99960 [Plicaturopsis crispa FD-325 SS-3]|nr:hypothetical protein PLICRDRAFT_99960 [Plicaturopsis crispa FD-325 SS-3]